VLRQINGARKVFLIISSSVLLRLSFPGFNLEFLAWFALVPLLLALKDADYKEALALSYLCGLFFFGLVLFWLRHVSFPGYIVLISILSIFFAIFGVFFLHATRYPLYAVFSIPALWVFLEYTRSNLFTGFGWALLGHSQYMNLPIIQISDVTGAYGVSYLIMMVNVIIYNVLQGGVKKNLSSCLAVIVIIACVLGYGYVKLSITGDAKETLKISVIQGNIPQPLKWDPDYKEAIYGIYAGLTEDAAKDGPDLIIWPETALPDIIEKGILPVRLREAAANAAAHLLIGAASYGNPKGEIFNSAFLISDKGSVVKKHDKLHLVPFGEYVPFAEYMDFVRRFIDKPIGELTKGSEYTIFELKEDSRFGVLICFEDIFSGLVREFALKDADFMVNITNDAWFMKSSAPYQHAQSSVFRAVENRVPVVRAANTGLSCFIDKTGRITGSVNVRNSEICVRGYKTGRVNISPDNSFYKRFGDIFIFCCLIGLILGGGYKWVKGRLQY